MNSMIHRSLPALAVVAGLLLITACGTNGAASPTGGRDRPATQSTDGSLSTDPAVTGAQPLLDLDPKLQDQIGAVLIGPALDVGGVTEVTLQSPYTDDVLDDVCGIERGNGVYMSAFGQQREWEAPQLRIRQFAGAWGVRPAGEAVQQVRERLDCGSYQNREGSYRVLGERTLPRLSGLDDQLMFCEVTGEKGAEPGHLCTALLARGAIASRIETRAATAEMAEQVTRELTVLAARSLTAVA